jgi:hypothetical protein
MRVLYFIQDRCVFATNEVTFIGADPNPPSIVSTPDGRASLVIETRTGIKRVGMSSFAEAQQELNKIWSAITTAGANKLELNGGEQ